MVRAPEKYVFNVDIGKMGQAKGQQKVAQLMKQFATKKTYDPATGTIGKAYDPMQMTENFWFVKGSDSEGITVNTLTSAHNFGNLDDLEYFLKKLYRSLNIPIARIFEANAVIQNQGGDISYIQNPEKFEKAKFVKRVESTYEGYVEEISAEEFGKLASFLGAGRMKKEDDIDFSVGIVLNKKVGEYVKKGDTLFTVFANDEEKAGFVENKSLEIIKIGDVKKDVKYVYEVIE